MSDQEKKANQKEQIISLIKDANQQVDEFSKVETPNQTYFITMIKEQKRKAKKQFFFELAIFWLVALTILTGISASLFYLPILFISFQVLAIGALLGFYFLERKRAVHKDYEFNTSK